MRLFLVLVCCLAIPLVARAEDQGKNKSQKQATQGHQQQATQGHQQQAPQHQQQTATQSKHYGANTASHVTLNNSPQLKGQSQHHALNVQNNNNVQSSTKGKVATKHVSANTSSQLKLNNSSQSKGQGQRHALNAQKNNNVQSSANAKVTSQHFALSNSPNPKIASTKFNQNYRIQGSQNWQGQQYGAFQNYRDQRHDQGWWNNNYHRIVLISGGWYFWNAGYWYPAWGYDSAYAYYPYDGPIYAYNNLPPDQVVANVQSTLQAQGYYHGAVDGTLGPVTRAALATYQLDHSLYATAAIDEPTLESLGMG
jgi:hypothetical protein